MHTVDTVTGFDRCVDVFVTVRNRFGGANAFETVWKAP